MVTPVLVYDVVKLICVTCGLQMLSIFTQSTDKSVDGSNAPDCLAQISPDLKNPKKHVKNATQSMILSLEGGSCCYWTCIFSSMFGVISRRCLAAPG